MYKNCLASGFNVKGDEYFKFEILFLRQMREGVKNWLTDGRTKM